MTNIDADVRRAASSAASWSGEAAHDVAATLARAHQAKIEWDEGAGERWLRVVDAGHVSALVSSVLPLALIERSLASTADPLQRVTKIFVADVDGAELSCSPDVLAEVFGSPDRFNVIDPTNFSANDLWYATV